MTTILTLSTNISAGHRRAAEAVADAILATDPEARIIERDSMMLMDRRHRRVLTDTYLGILRYRPSFWNSLYRNKRISGGISSFFRRFFARALEEVEAEIDRNNPDVIICTQAIPARAVALLKERGRCHAPLLAVATDYGIHPYWANEHIDIYAVPCAEAAEQLVTDGVAAERIHVTGIPVNSVFENPPTRAEARGLLGLRAEGRYVLLMGGGNGLGIGVDDVKALEAIPELDGLLVIAGSNSRLEAELRDLPYVFGKERFIWPSVDHIETYYAAADVLVSKPGGLTMSEATSMAVPIVMVSPLPGQEVRNAEFLLRAGAALAAESVADLRRHVGDLLRNPGELARLAQCSGAVGRREASRSIAHMALTMAHEKSRGVSGRRTVLSAPTL